MEVDIVLNDEDINYEEEILKNPFSVKHWLRYIEHKKSSGASKQAINLVYERSLKELPGSYKIWYAYLKLRRLQVKGKCIIDPAYEEANSVFERSLVFMHKMPRIWIDYCEFLKSQQKITTTRQVFDRALQALPITQHNRIWPSYLKFVKQHDIPETAVRVYRRYLKLFPESMEEYIEYLISVERLNEGAVVLSKIVNDDRFASREGKSKHQLWNEFCDLISKNPEKIKSLNVDAIIRGGLKRYTDQVGQLWNSLADYYMRSGLFERARDIFEEGILTVTTVRDFTQIFDAYAQMEESLAGAIMDQSKEEALTEEDDLDLDLRLARFEHLIERRPLLLNSVLLRQNPHNVSEWHKRVKLLEGKPRDIIDTYTEAVHTVEPKLSAGKLHTLWISFAKFYEENNQVEDARLIFEKGTQVEYVKVNELANVWCEWTEMEIRHENYEKALGLMRKATTPPPHKVAYHDENETVQNRLHKSCKSIYDRIIDLKIATPQIIINYGFFLEENKYFEEAFKAYEKGISLFRWPNVCDIWQTYLNSFLNRYGGSKLERARDLFEQCLDGCPKEHAKPFFLLYAKLEEEHGMARHSMSIYEKASEGVLPEQRFEMFKIYINKAANSFGLPYTRTIYEKAIESLTDDESREMSLRFAELEKTLGEIDRARSIYIHCSEICDPRTRPEFWQTWKAFEIKHGNEDTMREMLRIRRSVQAKYNTQVNFMSVQMLEASKQSTGTVSDLAPGLRDDMRLLEAKAAQMAGEIRAETRPKEGILFVRGTTTAREEELAEASRVANPDEINIGGSDEDTDDEQQVQEVPLETRRVPTEVYGGLRKDDDEE